MTAIQTIFDLNGTWASAGIPGPAISVDGANVISIYMGSYGRPPASGTVLDAADISATFPDDNTYTGKLQLPKTILWSNNSEWTKTSDFLTPIIELNGKWADGGIPGPVITTVDNSISVDMSTLKRPNAHGFVLDPAHISINFLDDKTYTATLAVPGSIKWVNGATWTKVPNTPPAAPSGLHVVSITSAAGAGASTVTLGWTDNSNNEVLFTLHWDGTLAGMPTDTGAKNSAANATTGSFAATAGYTYTVYVDAYNQAGSTASASIQLTVPPAAGQRRITVSNQGGPAARSVTVAGYGFSPNKLIVLRITPKNLLHPTQFSTTAGGDGTFHAAANFSCVAGIGLTVTAFEDADPTGTLVAAPDFNC